MAGVGPSPPFDPQRSHNRPDIENQDRQPSRPRSQVEQATPNTVTDRETKVIRSNG